MLRIFEKRMLGMMYGPVADNGIWRTGYSDERDGLYDVLDTGRVVKTRRWRWLGLFSRMQGMERCGKRTLLKPEGTRRIEKPSVVVTWVS
jgi:hypothetical protein